MRSFPRTAVALLAAAALTAGSPGSAVPSSPDDKTILHVLNRIGYGARPGDVDRVRQLGLAVYIEQQLHPERTPEQIEAARKSREVLAELTEQKILRAAYSERQLEEVMTDFWFNHFNVFAGKGPTQEYLTEYEREAIRPHVFGKFRDLLEATATSPAMLFYLDNWQSADPDAQNARPQARPGGFFVGRPGQNARIGARFPMPMRFPAVQGAPPQNPEAGKQKRGLNENYGRELMELHTLGVDGGYTQQDVIAVARAFTGWTIAGGPRQGGDFHFEPRIHDAREKIVLGHKIKAGGRPSDRRKV